MHAVINFVYTKTIILFIIFSSIIFITHAQIAGCPDPAANNYNDSATINDGSCTYNNASINPTLNSNLNTALNETSGLIRWNKIVWTHNDSGNGPDIFSINDSTGAIIKTVTLTNATNVDWEDITQDDKYIYIGDFGNNANGNRKDLKIYRVKKSDVKNKTAVTAAVINFSYSDQTNFNGTGSNNTNFDCEALIAYGDSLFLFSKDWLDNKTRLYKLPKLPGTYTAIKTSELNVQGLITGAEIIADKRVIALSGYDAAVTPFVYLLYDFTDNLFFDANKRKIAVNQGLTQMEGICVQTDRKFYISNERLQKFITVPAKLQTINLGVFLNPYYSTLSVNKPALLHTSNNTSSKNVSKVLTRKIAYDK